MAMIEIDESYIDAAAPNGSALKNGRGLVLKNKFVQLHQSADQTLLFGQCSGSGKSNYQVSCDFIRPDNPTYRCSCPSRQFPCKHCLGLMYAYVQGKSFTVAEIPDDVADKREKLQQRAEKKKATANQPRKVNKSALKKKIQTQLKGLDLLETLTNDLVRVGMGNTTAKTARQIEEQAKQLGNDYLPGAQAALHNYTRLFASVDGSFDADLSASERESIYGEALDQLTRLQALIKQGRIYLSRRAEDPELKPETESAIAAWLGHAWQLRELRETGLTETSVELVQLAFHSYDDVARREYVDCGIWINMSHGSLQVTQTFRPYRATNFIKSDDSFFQVAKIEELCVYPGDVNPRVRWEQMQPRKLTTADLQQIRQYARSPFSDLIKEVKSNLKSPLADKRPVYLVNYERIGLVDDHDVIEDTKGDRLLLTDEGMIGEPASCHLLEMLPAQLHQQQAMTIRFHHDLNTQRLSVKPLSVVTDTSIVRLTY